MFALAPPPPDVVERLVSENSARWPEKFIVGPLVDPATGARVSLPILLGTPQADSTALDLSIAVALGLRAQPANIDDELVKECLLWPPRSEWARVRKQWPAIDALVSRAIGRKIASTLRSISDIEEGEELPEAIASALTSSPAAVARKLLPGIGDPVFVVLVPPNHLAWGLYLTEARKPGGKVAKFTRDLVLGCVKASTAKLDDIFDRWPGLVVACVTTVSALAGLSAEAELGNW